jgi:hypothetical protein
LAWILRLIFYLLLTQSNLQKRKRKSGWRKDVVSSTGYDDVYGGTMICPSENIGVGVGGLWCGMIGARR